MIRRGESRRREKSGGGNLSARKVIRRRKGRGGRRERKKSMERFLGKASVRLEEPVCIAASASVVGTKEGEGPLRALFDKVGEDDSFGAKNWEEAESVLQKEALCLAMKKGGVTPEEIRYIFAGDLLGQSIASSFGLSDFRIPLFGIYGACSTCGEALALGAMTIAGGFAERVACVTSSHFASAEREFRFPLEYGNQRPLSASWTVTGSGAFVLEKQDLKRMHAADGEGGACEEQEAGAGKEQEAGAGKEQETGAGREQETGAGKEQEGGACEAQRKQPCRALIRGMTIGRIVDLGLKDSMNMGACMAPAAASTVLRHFEDFGRGPEDYDCIITGDLGNIGRTALLDLLAKEGLELSEKHLDCGTLIYDTKTQDVHAGGSGCGCCAATLSAYVLKQLEEGFWKRVLFMPTGALLSKTSFNEGKTVPGICHALVLEAPEK